MSFNRQEKWLLGLFITLLGGFLVLVLQGYDLRNQVTTLSLENQTLSQRNQVLSRNNENLRYYYDLATEFALETTFPRSSVRFRRSL